MFTFSKDADSPDFAKSETVHHYTNNQISKAKGIIEYRPNQFGGVMIPPDPSCSSNSILDKAKCAISSFTRSGVYAMQPGNQRKLIVSVVILFGLLMMASIVFRILPDKYKRKILPKK